MDTHQDHKFNVEAADLLHDGLIDCPWNVDEKNSDIDKDLLLKMFRDSRYILQSNLADPLLKSHAEVVFETLRKINSLHLYKRRKRLNNYHF